MSKKFLAIYDLKKKPINSVSITTHCYNIEKLFNFSDIYLQKKNVMNSMRLKII